MQSWDEYEADYYGEYPYDRMDWNMRGRRQGGIPYEPEDRMDTRMRDGYGSEMRMRNRMNENMYPENRMFRGEMGQNGRRMIDPDVRAGMDLGNQRNMDDQQPRYPLDEDETWKDMEEFEGLYDELAEDIMEIIRQICDSIDGEGCAAVDGQLTRDMLDMMIDRVMEQMGTGGRMENEDQMGGRRENQNERMGNDGQMVQESSTDLSGAVVRRMNDAGALRRSLIQSLLFHELLRRRRRRRMHRRNRDEYRDRWGR